jgi:glycosyltransferase involved in cell wall biosynthesis
MNILFLSPVVPHPQTDGGRQRIHSILEALVDDHVVTFVGIGASDDFHAWSLASRLSPDSFALPLDDGAQLGDRLALPWWAHPSSVSRLERAGLWTRLRALPLDSYDAVHAEAMMTAPFAAEVQARYPRAAFVLDLPDISSQHRVRAFVNNWRSLLPFGVVREAIQIGQLYGLERFLFDAAAAVFVCSSVDRDRIKHRLPPERILVVPNCTHVGTPLPPARRDGSTLVFVGTMSYEPNDQGIRWFCRSVWPQIRRHVPDAQFVVVGKSPSSAVQELAGGREGITVTGAVDDVRPYLASASASVVPLFSGGGTRLKILESMAAGRAVVSTSIGAEGIDATHDYDIVLADTAQALADACVRILREPDFRERIAAHGRTLVEEMYDWRHAQVLVRERYAELNAGRHRAQ